MTENDLEIIAKNLISRLSDMTPKMIATTQQLADQNSGSYHIDGLEKTARMLRDQLSGSFDHYAEIPLEPLERVEDNGTVQGISTTKMLKFSRNTNAPLQILMTGHYDTVFPENSSFNKSWIDGELLRGPGVADMKGGIVVAQAAIDAIAESPLNAYVGITLLLSPEEEIGSPSSGPLLTEFAKDFDYGMTYEPALSDGTLAGKRKGSGNFSCIFKGKSTHAGREYFAGKNAVVAAAEVAQKISELSDESAGITVNVGAISGGGPVNVVPDNAVLRFNVRVETTEQMNILDTIKSIIAECAESRSISTELKGRFNRPPKELTSDLQDLFDRLIAAGKRLGLSIKWQATGGCCEGNNLAAAGLANIDTLGVRGANIHSDQEYAIIESFVERAQLSALLILELIKKHNHWHD